MAKITDLPTTQALTGAEHLPIVQDGATKRVTMAAFRDLITPFLQFWYKGDKGDTGPAANTYTSKAALLGSDSTRMAAHLVGDPAEPDAPFFFRDGAWRRQDAEGIDFAPAGGARMSLGGWLRAPKVDVSFAAVRQTGSPVVAAGAAGALNGAYAYSVTFVTAYGETDAGPRTEPVMMTGQRAVLTNIPVSDHPAVIKRRIYRTVGNPDDVVRLLLVAEIADNITRTFTDNIADGALGAPVPWANTTGAVMTLDGVRVGNLCGNSVALGEGAGNGYAGTAIGNLAGPRPGRSAVRFVAVGVYACGQLEEGAEQIAGVGVHAFNDMRTGRRNAGLGYGVGFRIVSGVDNALLGDGVLGSAPGSTSRCSIVGSRGFASNIQEAGENTGFGNNVGLRNIIGARNLFFGNCAGAWCTISDTLIIDNRDRGSEQAEIDGALVYGRVGGVPADGFLKVNGILKSANAQGTTSALPSATSPGGAWNTDGSWYWSTGASTATTFASIFYHGGELRGGIQLASDGARLLSLSDRRAKRNVADAGDALPLLDQIKVRSFDWASSGERVDYGFIAQELHAVTPEAVSAGQDDMPWMVDAARLVPLLVKSIQEISQRLDVAEAKLAAL